MANKKSGGITKRCVSLSLYSSTLMMKWLKLVMMDKTHNKLGRNSSQERIYSSSIGIV